MPSASQMIFALALAAVHTNALSLDGTLASGAAGPLFKGTSAEGMTAYSEGDTTLVTFKPHQIGQLYLDMGPVTKAGSTVTITASADKPAILYAFVSGCYPCPATHGGFIGHVLNVEDWRLGFCGPVLSSVNRGRAFRMLSYAKDVPAGETYTLTVPGDADFLSFIAVEEFLNCPLFGTQQSCQDAESGPYQHCMWDTANGQCKFAYCHGNIGPSNDFCAAEACAPAAQSYLD